MQSLLISSQERLEVLAVKLSEVTVVNLLALITAAYIVLGALFLIVVGENPGDAIRRFGDRFSAIH